MVDEAVVTVVEAEAKTKAVMAVFLELVVMGITTGRNGEKKEWQKACPMCTVQRSPIYSHVAGI